MIRFSRSYRSTLRAFDPLAVLRVRDQAGTYWSMSSDLWWVGVRVEHKSAGCSCRRRIEAQAARWAGHGPEFLRGLRVAATLTDDEDGGRS